MLIFALNYTLAHEALCHGHEMSVLPEWFADSGNELTHDTDCDHHDDETHDHQLRLALIKKDPSAQQQVMPLQFLTAVYSVPCGGLHVASPVSQTVIYRTTSSLQAYVRAHILLL